MQVENPSGRIRTTFKTCSKKGREGVRETIRTSSYSRAGSVETKKRTVCTTFKKTGTKAHDVRRGTQTQCSPAHSTLVVSHNRDVRVEINCKVKTTRKEGSKRIEKTQRTCSTKNAIHVAKKAGWSCTPFETSGAGHQKTRSQRSIADSNVVAQYARKFCSATQSKSTGSHS